jgi:transcriptional regulator with XRE-family HTH domain
MKTVSNLEDKYVGKRLKLRRSELGVSQNKLAKFEKLTYQQIQKYESGLNRISSGRLYRFSKILHVPISYFFEGIEDIIEAKKGNAKTKIEAMKMDADMNADLRKLNLYFLKIKKAGLRKSVIAFVKNLAGAKDE